MHSAAGLHPNALWRVGIPPLRIVLSKGKPSSSSNGKAPKKKKDEKPKLFKTAAGNTVKVCAKTGKVICATTGRVIKRTAVVWPIKFVLGIFDLLAAPFGSMAGKDLNFSKLWQVGSALIIVAFWLYVLINSTAGKLFSEVGMGPQSIVFFSFLAKSIIPGGVALGGLCMILGGMRLQQGRSFVQKFGMGLEPLPAFESGVKFKIGDVELSLRDMHTGVGAFGGIGSGKSNAVSAWVSTPYGRKMLRDIVIGDAVCSPSGSPQKVENIIYAGVQTLWKVQTTTGEETKCSSDHLWWVKESGTPGEVLTQTGSLHELITRGKQFWVQTERSGFQWVQISGVEKTQAKEECRCLILSGTEHLFVSDGIVTHNCLDPDQELLMFDGTIKRVKDVRAGELLMGPDGNGRRILQTSTGYGPLYRIIPIKGSGKPWICNDAHVMTLRYTSQGGSRPARVTPGGVEEKDHHDRRKHYKGISQVFGEVPNKKVGRYYQRVLEKNNFMMDVPLRDFIARRAPSRQLDLFWKLFRPEGIEFPDLEEHDPSRYNYTHAALNPDEFYLAGAWIGDGFITSGWCSEDVEIKTAIKLYLAEHGRDLRIDHPYEHNQGFERIYPRKLGTKGGISNLEKYLLEFTTANLEQKAGCGGSLTGLYSKHGGTYDKDIPHWALTGPMEKRLSLLAGILDTDGNLQIEGRCFDLVQKRKHIIEKVVWLCRSVGLAAADPYEAWKECTNRSQEQPSVEDLAAHPALLQQLVDRAILKLELRVREGKASGEEGNRLRAVFAELKGDSPSSTSSGMDGTLRYEKAKMLGNELKEKTARVIELVRTAYLATVGKNPRREVTWKYVDQDREFAELMADFKKKCDTTEKPETEKSWLDMDPWVKAMVRLEIRMALFEEEHLPFNKEALLELLEFHRNEPRERYWRTTISGDIEKIPTRIPRKQAKSVRPEKRADGRGLAGIEDRNSKDPLCFGWTAEPIGEGPYCGFTLDGDGRFLLGDFTVTHNTVSLMVPMMRQFFRQLRDVDDNSEFAKCGALILDEKGDFIDSTITEMMLAGRSLQDLVIIDPDLDLYRYNPLDPNQTADENAAKLAKVQKILGTSSGGDNAYWDQTSQMTIKYFLMLLEVYKPKHKIGLDDIARFMRDDELATVLCEQVEKTIEDKKKSNEISEEAYGMYTDAISSTRNAWIQLNQNTKSTLKTTITNMLGPIASNPRLQKVFCRDTNFSFRDLPNIGKIVLFRGSGIDKSTARLICVCLKIDFQTWQKRRNGSAATAYGLNTMRTVMFMCDEYQEFVTCGGEGDETFYGVSRSTRTAPIVATQSYNSLETAIKNKEQTKTLRQNIATWVFFRSTDQDTCELGKFLAGQSKKEDFSTSQDQTGILETASNMSGGGGGKGSSISISRKLEENFRTDDFSRLVTMTMEKSRSGPWYSEAIVYHYHDIDDSAESRCYKTKLPHLYYDNKLRKQAGLNVKHLDQILYDRNWQRKAMQRGLLMIQRSVAETAALKKKDLEANRGRKDVETAKEQAENSPKSQERRKAMEEMLERAKREIAEDKGKIAKGAAGALSDPEDEDMESLSAKLELLEAEKASLVDEDEIERIQIRINDTKQKQTRFLLAAAARSPEENKEVLRADESLPYDDSFSDPEDEELEEQARRTSPKEDDDDDDETESSAEDDDENDDLWDTAILSQVAEEAAESQAPAMGLGALAGSTEEDLDKSPTVDLDDIPDASEPPEEDEEESSENGGLGIPPESPESAEAPEAIPTPEEGLGGWGDFTEENEEDKK
jgi:hypothetical protein